MGSSQVHAPVASDISIEISSSAGTVKPGETITYIVTARNLGPADATFIDVIPNIPDQLLIISAMCDYEISPDGPFCEYSSLPAGSRNVSIFTVTPNARIAHATRMLRVGATFMFEDPALVDPNNSNNTAWVKTKLVGKTSHP